jgi:hypothetical protein
MGTTRFAQVCIVWIGWGRLKMRLIPMKTISLIDTRSEVPGVSLGILVSTHPDVMAAFAANDAFQKAEASGRHIRTKISSR